MKIKYDGNRPLPTILITFRSRPVCVLFHVFSQSPKYPRSFPPPTPAVDARLRAAERRVPPAAAWPNRLQVDTGRPEAAFYHLTQRTRT